MREGVADNPLTKHPWSDNNRHKRDEANENVH